MAKFVEQHFTHSNEVDQTLAVFTSTPDEQTNLYPDGLRIPKRSPFLEYLELKNILPCRSVIPRHLEIGKHRRHFVKRNAQNHSPSSGIFCLTRKLKFETNYYWDVLLVLPRIKTLKRYVARIIYQIISHTHKASSASNLLVPTHSDAQVKDEFEAILQRPSQIKWLSILQNWINYISPTKS